jgi:ABC-type Mn2+/Zn2+ transport system ATPase subunit
MKLTRVWIRGFKNVRECEIEFAQTPLINAVIGSNGSGKSNLIEAVLHILIGVYFKKSPSFDFQLQFEAQGRRVSLRGESQRLSVEVDGEQMPVHRFAERLRDGPAQVFYPELTFVYYSGECQRVHGLIKRYTRHFQKLTRNPESDRYRPLFIESSNEQSQVILLALFAHGHEQFLQNLGLDEIVDVSLVLRSPDGFDPELHEPKLWNTVGAVRRIVAAIDETATSQESQRSGEMVEELSVPTQRALTEPAYFEQRVFHFSDGPRTGIRDLARRLSASGDNIYLALESLRARGIFRSVNFRLRGRNAVEAFAFEQLSEGEKQLLAVIGAIRLTNQPDNLVLLDEPDTHLNPQWSWDYPSMLAEAFRGNQAERSTVLMATHDPVMISGMVSEQVLLAHPPTDTVPMFSRPVRNPRGQGIANILCSSEFFGLPSSLDKETQKLLDERLSISIKPELTVADKARLKELNEQLEIIRPGISERDPEYVAFLRQRHGER